MNVDKQEVVAMLSRVKTGTIQDGLDELGLFQQSLSPRFRMVSPPKDRDGFVGPAKALLFYKRSTNGRVRPDGTLAKMYAFVEGYIEKEHAAQRDIAAKMPMSEVIDRHPHFVSHGPPTSSVPIANR